MKAYALMVETFLRKASPRILHLSWLAAYAPLFLISFPPGAWQWGAFVFAWSGCLLPLMLSAGIFGDDIASGRMRLLMTEPIRPAELYLYRFLGLSLQGTAHLLAAAALVLILHRLTGRGDIGDFALWMLASWLIFNAWTAISASISVVVSREHNSMVLVLVTIAAYFPLYMLLLFFENHLGTKVYHEIVRYVFPPMELLIRMGLGTCGCAGGVATVAHSLMLTILYGLAGIVLLGRREFRYAPD